MVQCNCKSSSRSETDPSSEKIRFSGIHKLRGDSWHEELKLLLIGHPENVKF